MTAAFLGLLEGLTEFLPVSSTGHLLLAGHFLGFESRGRTFEVVIQLGAILALTTVYAALIVRIALRARHDETARRTIVSVLLAFLPAVLVGLVAYDFIKTVLFETPLLIAIMLVLGGVVLLAHHGDYPIAAVIFIASVFVPLGKLFALSWLCWSVARHHTRSHHERGRLYRMTELVGKWSMTDVFVVAILVALIHLGGLLVITPGPAALAFGGVVIATMLAAHSFDPRLIWDHPGESDG